LEEDGARGILRGVGGNCEWRREVGNVEDGFREEKHFQDIKSGLTVWGPFPWEVLFGEVDEGVSDVGVVGDEATIEVGEAKEGADIFYLGRGGPTGNAVSCIGEHVWFAFREVCCRGEDKEVVHVDDEPSFSDHITEEIVHEVLEGCRGVGKSEEHYHGFKEALVGDQGGFPLVSVFDSDIVVSPMNIELGEHLGILEFVDEVRDEGKRVGIMNRVFIDVSVVLAGLESSILLFTKKKGGLGGS
jgi:hypothetical protein